MMIHTSRLTEKTRGHCDIVDITDKVKEQLERQKIRRGLATLFVAGYLITWAGAGLVGYGVYELGKAVTGDTFSWHNAGPELAGRYKRKQFPSAA